MSLISTLCVSIAVVSPAPSAVHLRVLAGRPVDPVEPQNLEGSPSAISTPIFAIFSSRQISDLKC